MSLTGKQLLSSALGNDDSASMCQAVNSDKTLHSRIRKVPASNQQLAYFNFKKIGPREVIKSACVPHSSKPDRSKYPTKIDAEQGIISKRIM
jgi:hypothetical protein